MIGVDILTKQVIAASLVRIKEQPILLDSIFRILDQATRDTIKRWYAGVVIETRLGWVQQTTHMPCVAVTVPSASETTQVIGSSPGQQYDTDSDRYVNPAWIDAIGYHEEQTTFFGGGVDAAIYSINGEETAWLACIVMWILLEQRDALEDAGLLEQRLTMTDFMPASDYPQPDPAYTRVVKLQYTSQQWITVGDAEGPTNIITNGKVINESDNT